MMFPCNIAQNTPYLGITQVENLSDEIRCHGKLKGLMSTAETWDLTQPWFFYVALVGLGP